MSRGYSIIELLFAIGLGLTATAVAVPQTLAAVETARTLSAARYVAGRLQRARMDAVSRSVDVGLQFVAVDGSFVFATYADGNGNGIRSRDIAAGVDPAIVATERLGDRFAGVEFGVLPGLPPVDPSGAPPGSDPIKAGAGNILTFGAAGTSSSGSLYVLGPRSTQYVVRVFGETGRTRVLKFDSRTRTWNPL